MNPRVAEVLRRVDTARGNIVDRIADEAKRRPDAPALIRGHQVLSYGALDLAISRMAAALASRGVSTGDVVGITLGNDPLHVVVLLGLARIGAVSVPVHRLAPQAQRAAIVDHYGVRAIIARRPDAAVGTTPIIVPDPSWIEAASAPPSVAVIPGGERPWSVRLTSGTTGVPKAVLVSHASTLMLMELRQSLARVGPGDRLLVAMDLNVPAALHRGLQHLLYGSPLVFPRSMRDPREVLATITEHRITHAYASPEMVRRWLEARSADQGPFPTLLRLTVVGGSLPESLWREATRRLTPGVLVNYGSTETGGHVAELDAETLKRYPGCAGRVLPWVEAQVVDDLHRALPHGETGLLRFRGPGFAAEYYRNPEATARAFRDGWVYTGDMGSLDDSGILHVSARADDLINLGGTKVTPAEVEPVLLEHPDVAEAAVFGVTNPAGKAVLMAAVVTRRPIAEGTLLAYARARLGAIAPRRILALPELPRNAMGKVMRQRLAASIRYRNSRS